jgi:uncharacterized protein (UPF0548 family)
MPRRPPLSRRVGTALFWPVGVTLTSVRYLGRTTPLHRREYPGSPERDAPPPLPPTVDTDDLQPPEAGAGPLFHRRYRARIRDSHVTAEELVGLLSGDPDRAAPTEFARFLKVRGEGGVMRTGDEYVVRMPGPWDGPVRVIEVTPTSFRLATLTGHLEAGQIEFRAEDEAGGRVLFTIESWARSGDRLSRLLYEHLRMSKEVQLHMWTSFLERVVKLAKGRLTGGIDIDTRVVEDEAPPRGRGRDARDVLGALHARPVNFELLERDAYTARAGWTVDEYREPLPEEPPGAPVPGGSWEVACRLIRDYEFADPEIIRAVYHPDRPLEERDMLLEARYHGLRFRFGVRVGGVRDETTELDGRPVRIWGWNYRTLQGHLEMGQMDFEAWKWLDTGEVEFRTRRFFRTAPIRNPVVRLGFRLFARRQQIRFVDRARARMAALVAAEVEHDGRGRELPPAAEAIDVRPAAGSGPARRGLDDQIGAGAG